jgi:hypothetical protein
MNVKNVGAAKRLFWENGVFGPHWISDVFVFFHFLDFLDFFVFSRCFPGFLADFRTSTFWMTFSERMEFPVTWVLLI